MLHCKGHKACHAGNSIDSLPQDRVMVKACTVEHRGVMINFPAITVKDINTQAAEQCNSQLHNIRTQIAFMGQAHYMGYARLWLFSFNQCKIQDIAERKY